MEEENRLYFYGFFLCVAVPLCMFAQINLIRNIAQSTPEIQDVIFEVDSLFDGRNISVAREEKNAFLLEPDVNVTAHLQYLIVSNQSINVEKLRTVFTWADMDIYSKTDKLDFTLSSGSNFTFIQTWNFKNYVGSREIGLLSGIYQVRYDLHYMSEGETRVLKGIPFYVRFSGNPLTSAFGVVSTVALAQAGLSLLGLVNSTRKSIQIEVEKSIENTNVSPTDKLMGYYRGKSYKKVQNEVSNAAYRYAAKVWRGERCPQCGEAWPEGRETCPGCQITLEKAQQLYSNKLGEKALNASKEVVDSVSGLSLKSIADDLGEGVIPTTSIISVLTFSGLTLVQPRISNSWKMRTRKLVFTTLRTTLFSLFWIQACGLGTTSLLALVIALLSGLILPMIIGRVFGNNIRQKINEYWKSKQLST